MVEEDLGGNSSSTPREPKSPVNFPSVKAGSGGGVPSSFPSFRGYPADLTQSICVFITRMPNAPPPPEVKGDSGVLVW